MSLHHSILYMMKYLYEGIDLCTMSPVVLKMNSHVDSRNDVSIVLLMYGRDTGRLNRCPGRGMDRTLGTFESWRTNKRRLSEEMTEWIQSKHTDQISETKESSSTIIDTAGGNLSIVISQRQMHTFNNDHGTVYH